MKKYHPIIITLAMLPFFAGCSTWHAATISNGISHGITYDEVKAEIEAGADIECYSLLKKAALQERKDLVKLFVENGASCFNSSGFSLFQHAIRLRDEELLQLCLDHPDKEKEPMMRQIFDAAEEMKKWFLSDSEYKDWNISFLAKIYSSKILGEERSEEFNPNNILTEELLLSVKYDYLTQDKAVKFAISNGANVNVKDSEGNSALFLAKGQEINGLLKSDSIKALKDAGAKMSPAEAQQILSNVYNREHGSVKFDAELRDYISSGGNVNVTIESHSLIYCVINRYGSENIERACELIALLEKNGAKPLAVENEELKKIFTKRLLSAVKEGDDKGVKVAISNGANVNVKDSDGHSVLFLAKGKEINGALESDSIKALKDAGAKISPAEYKELIVSKIDGILSEKNVEGGVDKVLSEITAKDFLNAKDSDGSSIYCSAIVACMNKPIEYVMNPGKDMGILLGLGDELSEKLEQNVSKMSNKLCYMLLNSVDSLVNELKTKGVKFTQKEIDKITDEKTQAYYALLAAGRWNEIATLAKNGFDLKREKSIARLGGENAFHCLNANSLLGIAFGIKKGYANGDVDESIIVALKKAGVDINKKTDEGYSPLAIAIGFANVEVVKALLKYGANPKDTVPIKGALGKVGEKSLMSFAIEACNKSKKIEHNENTIEVLERYKEIVWIMSEATGIEVKTLGDF